MNKMHPHLEAALLPVRQTRQHLWLWKKLGLCWLATAAVAVILGIVIRSFAWPIPSARTFLLLTTAVASLACWLLAKRRTEDLRDVARSIESSDPRLKSLLLTAVEQVPEGPDGSWGFLQERVITSALEERRSRSWSQPAIEQLFLAQAWSVMFFCALVIAFFFVPNSRRLAEIRQARLPGEITVTPGDAEVEKGHSVAVLIRFPDRIPAQAELVWTAPDGREKSLALVKNLNDPVFGGTLPALESDIRYRIQYDKSRTREFSLKIFEKPDLLRSDAHLVFPEYTRLPQQKLQDTRRVTAVEGTTMRMDFKLNKPVVSATFVATNRPSISLQITGATAVMTNYLFATNASYSLQLVDAQKRTNLVLNPFHFDSLTNRTPEIKLLAPKGDSRVSPLEELEFQANVRDDFGVVSAGISYVIPGRATNSITLARSEPATNRTPDSSKSLTSSSAAGVPNLKPNSTNQASIKHVLRLEEQHLSPGDLIAWNIWAEDYGPDGKIRRTSSDLYFAEVRPFREIYRQGDLAQQNGGGGGGGGGQGNQTLQLADLQKQILNATWKLQSQAASGRPPRSFVKDVGVVRESQEKAMEQLESLASRAQTERAKTAAAQASKAMEAAVDSLSKAEKKPDALSQALLSEQAAYQAILKLAPREHEVVQNRQRGGGGGGQNQRNRGEIDELDVKPTSERYETQRQAEAQQEDSKNESQQLLNRLKELAQRQQDINERINELASARNRAKSEAEKEEIDRRLKRLREEQRQMLEDVDEMAQRLEQNRGNSNTPEDLKRQTQEARNQVREASDALESRDVSDALAAGTRAQRQFQQMRDEVRKQASNQVVDKLRELRQEARDLAQKESEINQRLKGTSENKQKSLSSTSEPEALRQALSEQARRMTNIISHAAEISDLAESSEPVLASQLYDTLRQTAQQEVKSIPETRDELMKSGQLTRGAYELLEDARLNNRKPLEVASNMLRNGQVREGAALENKVLDQIKSLQKGVESASSHILGDDTEALKRARRDLDALEDAVARESAGNSASSTNRTSMTSQGEAGSEAPSSTGEKTGRTPGQSERDGSPSERQMASNSGQGQPQSGNGRNGGRGQGRPNGQAEGEQGKRDQDSTAQAEQGQQGQGGGNGNQAGPGQRQGGRRSLIGRDGGQRGGRTGNPQSMQRAGGGGGGGSNQLDGPEGRGGGEWDGSSRGPITGEDFAEWNNRLRNIESGVDSPEIRNGVAQIRERIRELRIEARRHSEPPQEGAVQKQVLGPLTEVRNRIQEELARRESKDSLVPLDRDPVPTRYTELVKRYYERLGRGN